MSVLRDVALVFMGGGLGALTRYGIGLAMLQLAGKSFPWGTLLANVIGCLLAGIIGQRVLLMEPLPAGELAGSNPALAHFLRVAIMIGFLGGLTTFSAFGWETMSRLVDKNSAQQFVAIINIGANLLLGLSAVWLGMQLARWW